MPVLPSSTEKFKAAPRPPREFDVRTIPAKFLTMRPSAGQGSYSSGLKKNIFIGLILVVVIGGAMALAAWLFLKSVKKENPPVVNAPLVNTQPATLDQQPIAVAPTTTEVSLDYLLDTSRWQLYTDSVYQYALKYPAEWTVKPASLPSIAYVLSSLAIQDQNGLSDITISIFDNPNNLTLSDWLDQEYNLEAIDCENYKLDNQDACRYNEVTGQSFVVYALYNKNFYALTFLLSDKTVVNQVYTQILNNWHFPPPLPADEEEETGLDTSPATDSDADGLTDSEEIIYRTNKNNADTDGDGYQDGLEVANLYNPIIAGSAKLLDSDLVKTHVDENYHYNLLYPSGWRVRETSNYIIFQDVTGEEFIQVIIEDNSNNYKDVKEWYQKYLKQDPALLTDTVINGGTPAIMTEDKMKIYFFFDGNVYGLIYNPNTRQYGNFFTTFNMVVKSFHLMSVN